MAQSTQMDVFRANLKALEPQLKVLLPESVPVERFARIILTAAQLNPALLEADRNSLYAACFRAAEDALLPDGREAALVIFNTKSGKKVQYMPMVRGIVKKIRNSGEIANLNAHVVYENDYFSHWINAAGEFLEHKPCYEKERGKLKLCYAIARLKGIEEPEIEVMTESEVKAAQSVSKAKDGPWQGEFESEMWKKTVLRRISKRLPMSADLEKVMNRDDEMFEFKAEPKSEEPKKKSSRLSGIVAQALPEPQPEAELQPVDDFDENAPVLLKDDKAD